jgi:hypothetical protein
MNAAQNLKEHEISKEIQITNGSQFLEETQILK